jgi:MerR family transcriptional regulator, copper efflux regulator
MGKVKPRLT